MRCTYLLPPADVTTAAAGLPVTTDVDAYIAERAKTLLPAITPPEAEKLDRTLDDLQPRIRITDRTFENQSYRASGLNLVIAAIVYWNTVYMERAIAHLRSTGVTVPDHLPAHTSPLGWSHISLTGDYLWEQAAIAVDGFRPLNTARSRLKLVA